MRKIIYEGNSVYELDEEAMLKKQLEHIRNEKKQEKKNQSLSDTKHEKKRT